MSLQRTVTLRSSLRVALAEWDIIDSIGGPSGDTMGLDISAYRGLQEVTDADLDDDGLPVDENLWLADKLIIEFTEEHWPGRSAGVTPGVYSFAEAFHFKAGLSTGFGLWRDALARLVLRM